MKGHMLPSRSNAVHAPSRQEQTHAHTTVTDSLTGVMTSRPTIIGSQTNLSRHWQSNTRQQPVQYASGRDNNSSLSRIHSFGIMYNKFTSVMIM